MYIEELSTPGTLLSRVAPQRLLVVGPQQTPFSAASTTMQIFLDQVVNRRDIEVVLVDSAPLTWQIHHKRGWISLAVVRHTVLLLWHYCRQITRCNAVLLFVDTPLSRYFVLLLLLLARLWNKRFLVKPAGGDLDLGLAGQGVRQQRALIGLLNRTDGILVQTIQLQRALEQLGVSTAYYVPGWRPSHPIPRTPRQRKANDGLRLLFLAAIEEENGPYVLLHALQEMAYQRGPWVTCDFYGPITTAERLTFVAELTQTPQACYGGTVEPANMAALLADYDVLVLPTWSPTEGHPGIILDAMTAGLPVISTNHRAIPELIQHGVNGLLTPTQNSVALKEAIIHLAQNPLLRQRMGVAGYNRAQAFRADQIVPQILRLIFPNPAKPEPNF